MTYDILWHPMTLNDPYSFGLIMISVIWSLAESMSHGFVGTNHRKRTANTHTYINIIYIYSFFTYIYIHLFVIYIYIYLSYIYTYLSYIYTYLSYVYIYRYISVICIYIHTFKVKKVARRPMKGHLQSKQSHGSSEGRWTCRCSKILEIKSETIKSSVLVHKIFSVLDVIARNLAMPCN